MGEEKRYGAWCGHPGWTLDEFASGAIETGRFKILASLSEMELARDLLAAQQRILELEAKLDRVQALVPKFRWKAKKLGGSRYGEGGSDAHTDCADDLAEALEQHAEKGPTP